MSVVALILVTFGRVDDFVRRGIIQFEGCLSLSLTISRRSFGRLGADSSEQIIVGIV
jgi:hypothetical protein